ncbi:hypothetical protein GHY11_12145 [Salmonella enterica]|nr:hypothetical protein [Salmonella enterica]
MWRKFRKMLKGVRADRLPSSVSCPTKDSLRQRGYLIKSKIVYTSHPIPADSAYLFVSNRNYSERAT